MSEGERLQHARHIQGLTQEEFCILVGINHQSYLSSIETGSRPVSKKMAYKIEETTNISAQYILHGAEPMIREEGHQSQGSLTGDSNTDLSGERLAKWIATNNYTQKEVAERIGYKQVSLSAAIGRGSVSKKLATKLEQEFGLSRAWLLQGIGTPSNTQNESSAPNPTLETQKHPETSVISEAKIMTNRQLLVRLLAKVESESVEDLLMEISEMDLKNLDKLSKR